ncbi:MAG: response regulator transcription factor [Dehalococcoidia bacterium]
MTTTAPAARAPAKTAPALLDMDRGVATRPSPTERYDEADWDLGDLLIVERDPRSAALLESILQSVVQRVRVVSRATEAVQALSETPADLVTVALDLGDLPGLPVLPFLRAASDAPIVVVTSPAPDLTMADGLDAGADDYILKPVRPAEVRARVRAIARRSGARRAREPYYVDDQITIDFRRSEVVTANGASRLSSTERRVLRELVGRAGNVLSHEEILRRVWGHDYKSDVANLQVFISYLRRKLDDDPRRPTYIRTHRGIGYEFCPRAARTA